MIRTVALAFILVTAGACDDVLGNIEGNVPEPSVFHQYLRRDLQQHFCAGQVNQCRVEYTLLRDGPTQSGTSFPKYYLWIECFVGETLLTAGALKVAAIDKRYFEIREFLSAQDIAADPTRVGAVFPAALVDAVVRRANAH